MFIHLSIIKKFKKITIKKPNLKRLGFFDIIKCNDYASNGSIETYDLLSLFFWNLTSPSTFACKV